MIWILRCDWLLERARWRYLARSGLPAVSRKEKVNSFPYNKLSIDDAWSIKMAEYNGLVHFLRKKSWQTPGHLDLTLGQQLICICVTAEDYLNQSEQRFALCGQSDWKWNRNRKFVAEVFPRFPRVTHFPALGTSFVLFLTLIGLFFEVPEEAPPLTRSKHCTESFQK